MKDRYMSNNLDRNDLLLRQENNVGNELENLLSISKSSSDEPGIEHYQQFHHLSDENYEKNVSSQDSIELIDNENPTSTAVETGIPVLNICGSTDNNQNWFLNQRPNNFSYNCINSNETSNEKFNQFLRGFGEMKTQEISSDEEKISLYMFISSAEKTPILNNLQQQTHDNQNIFLKLLKAVAINSEVKKQTYLFNEHFESYCENNFKRDSSELSLVSDEAADYDINNHNNNNIELPQRELRHSSSDLEAQKNEEKSIAFVEKIENFKKIIENLASSYSISDSETLEKLEGLKNQLNNNSRLIGKKKKRKEGNDSFKKRKKRKEGNDSIKEKKKRKEKKDSINKKKKRKEEKDLINKKLLANGLSFLSTKLPMTEKDLFREPKNCSIEANKAFNRMPILSIIEDSIRKKYETEDLLQSKLDEIKKEFNDFFLSMTFAQFFDDHYLPSEHFKTLLIKNSKDTNYLISLIENAFSYVDYFETKKGNKPKKRKETETGTETETETESY